MGLDNVDVDKMLEECDPHKAECFNSEDKVMILKQLRAHNVYVKDQKGNVAITNDWEGNFKRQLLKALQYSSGGPVTVKAEDEAEEARKAEESKKVIDDATKKYGAKPLVTAADKKDEGAVVALLAAGYKDLEEKGEYDSTPIIKAAARGHESIVKALLAAGANKDAQDEVSSR